MILDFLGWDGGGGTGGADTGADNEIDCMDG